MRIENLKALVKKEGGAASLARRFDVDASYISQLINGHRGFGEKSARSIEEKLKLKSGWLDNNGEGDNYGKEIAAIYTELPDDMKLTLIEFALHMQEKHKKSIDEILLDKLYGHAKPIMPPKNKKLFIKN